MDNLEDAKEMMTYAGQEKVFQAHLKTIFAFVNDEIKPKEKAKPTAKKAATKGVKNGGTGKTSKPSGKRGAKK